MKTLLGISCALAAVLCLGVGTLSAQEGDLKNQLLKQFDRNNNGKLDPEEMQAAQAARQKGEFGGAGGEMEGRMQQMKQMMLQRFDRNGNGQLDPEEQMAAKQAFMQGGFGKGKMGERGPGFGGRENGQGGLDENKMKMIMQQFDRNRNGRLEPQEMQAAQQAMQQMQGQQGAEGFRRPMFNAEGNGKNPEKK